jgi:hypothetical protein
MSSKLCLYPSHWQLAVTGDNSKLNNFCTQQGYLPLTLYDGSTHWQLCFYCKNAVETIISPQAILATSNVFVLWMQTGFKDGRPGQIRFDSHNGLTTIGWFLSVVMASTIAQQMFSW